MAKFVYKTINVKTGKFYIGAHTGRIDDNYLGSGVAIKRAIAKYSRSSFRRIILETAETDEELYEREQYHITKHIDDPLCYNLHSGGKGGWAFVNINQLNAGDKNSMRRPEIAAKMASSLKQTQAQNPEKYAAVARENGKKAALTNTGMKHSQERIQREREASLRRWQQNYDKMCDSMASTFEVISPNGETFVTRKLEDFCKDRGLPYTTIWKTSILGRPCLRGRAKGWKCQKI